MPDKPTDRRLDARLRQMARASLARDAATVDTHADILDLRTRLSEGRTFSASPTHRTSAGRLLVTAAATVLVVGVVVAIAWTRGADNRAAITLPPPVSTVSLQPVTTPSLETDPLASAPSTSLAPLVTPAAADPTTVRAGGELTITPAGTIERACDFRIRATRLDGPDAGQVGAISSGSWHADDAIQVASPNCTGDDTGFLLVIDEPLTVGIPRNMPAGTYELCLTASQDLAGCARVTVTRSPDEATAEPATVTAGELVTITPAEVIQRACQDVVTVMQLDNAAGRHGQLVDGRWIPTPGSVTQVTLPSCHGELSDAAVQFVIAADMPPGVFAMCLVEHASYQIQQTSDPGCAIVTVTPAPLPACWTEPVAPPTLVDGSDPGEPTIDQGRAFWGDPGSSTAISQSLGRAPDSWWLDEAPDAVRQVSSGSLRAAVVNSGDFAGAGAFILVRDIDVCDRQYEVGPIPLDEAVALAQGWVNAIALGGTLPPEPSNKDG